MQTKTKDNENNIGQLFKIFTAFLSPHSSIWKKIQQIQCSFVPYNLFEKNFYSNVNAVSDDNLIRLDTKGFFDRLFAIQESYDSDSNDPVKITIIS